jgi:uncharacterized damage-inducible protein DinB
MPPTNRLTDRRNFLRSGALIGLVAATPLVGLPFSAGATKTDDDEHLPADEGLYMIGPRDGYSSYIGSLVSMMNYNRHTILQLTKGLTMEQLDHLQDADSNTIGALMMHLAAVDKIYYIMCFENRSDYASDEKQLWAPALELGDKGRQTIKGKELSYYVDLLTVQREKTLKALKEKDDQWLLAYDPTFDKTERFNNYWKWFHVCEHESHHRGQMSWLKKRLPGMKDTKD